MAEYSTTLIRAAKSKDKGVIEVEILERWQKLKVHRMSLVRCFEEEKMELLCREIELSTRINLKILPQ